MKNKFFKKIILSMTLAQWTLAPWAQASEIDNVRKIQMKQVLNDLGYNTTQRRYTVDEIWTTTKYLFNEKDRDYLDRWVAYNGDQLMPKVDVVEEKDKSGDLQYRWMVQGPEGFVTLTFIGEDQKFIKINDKVFSKMEIFEQIPVVTALADQKFSKKAEALNEALVKVKAPRLITSDWIKMTPEQRAEYLIEVRKTLMASVDVLEGDGKKTAQNYLKKYELWLSEVVKTADAKVAQENGMCVVAGYVGKYMNGPHISENGNVVKSGLHCSVTHAQIITKKDEKIFDYESSNKVDEADYEKNIKDIYSPTRNEFGKYNSQCNTGSVSCNPYIFGMSRENNGKPICIQMSGSSYSTATATCDAKSPLGDEANTKAMIQSMMKATEGSNSLAQFLNCKEKCKIAAADLDKLRKEILEPFNIYIDGALRVCEKDQKKYDKLQDSACTTLKKRQGLLKTYINSLKPETVPDVNTPVVAKPPEPAIIQPKPNGKPPVQVASDTSDVQPTDGKRKAVEPPQSTGFCGGNYKYACIGAGLFATFLAGRAMLNAQANALKINTPTYVPPVVNGCPSNWVQTGSTSSTCYPPNYTTGTTSTIVAPPAPIITTTTTTSSSSSGGTR